MCGMRARCFLFLVLIVAMLLGAAPASALVIRQLPEDGAQRHVSLVVHDNWRQVPAEVDLVARWQAAQEPGVFFHLYTESHPIYRARIADSKWSQTIPCLILQEPDGFVAKQASEAPEVTALLGGRVWRTSGRLLRPRPICPGPNCPAPAPVPVPVPAPVPAPIVVQPPAPEPEPASTAPWIIAAVLLCLGGVGLGVAIPIVQHFKND